MSTSGYGKIERGEIDLTISKISRIAGILGISVSELLFFDVSLIFNASKNREVTKDSFIDNSEVRVMKMDRSV
ncbi:MAG: helix-turn-helix transcriptional regulator [Flavobacterium sp.]|nr:helix-turn-helix transcriptional regulator [Flavobacterium sp.]